MVQAGLTAPYGQYGQAGGDAASLAAQAAAAAAAAQAAAVGQGVPVTSGSVTSTSNTGANNVMNQCKLDSKDNGALGGPSSGSSLSVDASSADVASLAALEGLNPAALDQSALAVSL